MYAPWLPSVRFRRFGWLLALGVIVGAAPLGCGEAGVSRSEQPSQQPQQDQQAERGGGDGPASAGQASAEQASAAELPRVGVTELEALIEEAAGNDRVVVIDFWATWCVPCVQIFPGLHDRLKAMGQEVRAVSVTLDAPDSEAKAIEFLREHDAMKDAYMLVPDSDRQLELAERMGERWKSLVVPAILVYDQQGALSREFIDAKEATPDAIGSHVESLLSKE